MYWVTWRSTFYHSHCLFCTWSKRGMYHLCILDIVHKRRLHWTYHAFNAYNFAKTYSWPFQRLTCASRVMAKAAESLVCTKRHCQGMKLVSSKITNCWFSDYSFWFHWYKSVLLVDLILHLARTNNALREQGLWYSLTKKPKFQNNVSPSFLGFSLLWVFSQHSCKLPCPYTISFIWQRPSLSHKVYFNTGFPKAWRRGAPPRYSLP